MMKLADLLASVSPRPSSLSSALSMEGAVHDLFRIQALATPQALAVSSHAGHLTYEELDRQSDEVAHRLLTQYGVQPEELIPVLMERSPKVVVAMLGVLKAGAAYVPILPSDPPQRIAFILSDTRCRTVIAEAALEAVVRASAAAPSVYWLDDLPCENGAGKGSPLRVQASNLAYVMYTSGTSGRPKGVMIEHRGIVRLVVDQDYIAITPTDRFLQTGSLAFDAATFEIWGALLNGASVHLAQRDVVLGPAALQELIRRESITIAWFTVALFNQLVDISNEVFKGLRVLLTGGDRLSAKHICRVRHACPDLTILNGYGPTENTTFTTVFSVDRDFERDVPIGRPVRRTSVAVCDPDLRVLPPHAVGELCTGGDGLSRGYLNDPVLTAQRFVPDPAGDGTRIYRTGDLARWRSGPGEDQVLEFCGRNDSQVKIRGFRIEPGEIEARLREITGIRDAVVMVHRNAGDEASLVAYLVGDAGLEKAKVRNACKASFPHYMVPADFLILERFPQNANGKVDRSALPMPKHDVAPRPSVDAEGGGSATLGQLRSIWEEILGRQDISENDDFFDLGGHSLSAVQMVSFVEQRMKVVLPINVVFDAPNLRDLTSYILDTARFGVDALDNGMVFMGGNPEAGALFAFPPGTADCIGYLGLAAALRPAGFFGFTFIESDDRIRQYADLIQSSAAAEPYCLFGYSSGGNLAYHVAYELESRGAKVASVVLLDSARQLAELGFTAQQMAQVATDFLSDQRASVYLTSEVLRDKAHRNIVQNLAYISSCLDTHTIAADIHLLSSEGAQDVDHDGTGRVVSSKAAWKTATTGQFLNHAGAGRHSQMLHHPHFEKNAALLRAILSEAMRRT